MGNKHDQRPQQQLLVFLRSTAPSFAEEKTLLFSEESQGCHWGRSYSSGTLVSLLLTLDWICGEMEKYRRMERTTTVKHCEHHLHKSFALLPHPQPSAFRLQYYSFLPLLLHDHDPLPHLQLPSITTTTKSLS